MDHGALRGQIPQNEQSREFPARIGESIGAVSYAGFQHDPLESSRHIRLMRIKELNQGRTRDSSYFDDELDLFTGWGPYDEFGSGGTCPGAYFP